MTFVLLTGATRGIGRAAAVELAKEGAEVALVGRDAERVRDVAREAGSVAIYRATWGGSQNFLGARWVEGAVSHCPVRL